MAALRGVDVCGGRRLLRTFKIVCAPAAPQVMFAVMIEGLVFMVMSALDVRRWIMKTFPRWLMSATMAGIGLFLAQIGLHGGNGIDLVRDHPAIYLDAFNTAIQHSARTWLGIFMFFLMAALVTLRVKGAVMIAILASTFTCWIAEAAGEKQFVYQPQCCLGEVTYTTATEWYPASGASWLGPQTYVPQPICGGSAGAFEVSGKASNTDRADGAEGFYASSWSGARVTGSYYNWTVTDADGTEHYVPGRATERGATGLATRETATTSATKCLAASAASSPVYTATDPAGAPS